MGHAQTASWVRTDKNLRGFLALAFVVANILTTLVLVWPYYGASVSAMGVTVQVDIYVWGWAVICGDDVDDSECNQNIAGGFITNGCTISYGDDVSVSIPKSECDPWLEAWWSAVAASAMVGLCSFVRFWGLCCCNGCIGVANSFLGVVLSFASTILAFRVKPLMDSVGAAGGVHGDAGQAQDVVVWSGVAVLVACVCELAHAYLVYTLGDALHPGRVIAVSYQPMIQQPVIQLTQSVNNVNTNTVVSGGPRSGEYEDEDDVPLLNTQDTPPSYATSKAGPGTSTTAIDKLTAIAGLRDSGILTEEEFQAKKAELIGQL